MCQSAFILQPSILVPHMQIKVYQSEKDCGLAELITSNNSLSYCSQAEKMSGGALIGLNDKNAALAQISNEELFYVTRSVLATTSWNKNDDVFGPVEVWNARHTPVHSPTNINHDQNQIVGHVTTTWVINEDGNLIDDATEESALPNKFHLCNSALIYRKYRDKVLNTRAENLITEIESGKKFVSMECLFPSFDYAVISPENEYFIIARNEETSFLTRYLRTYGGCGTYKDNKIGRFLKQMVFSGKGYVDNPANPESIIFDNEVEFKFASASYQQKWFDVKHKTIITVPETITKSVAQITENNLMAEDTKQLDDLKAELAETKAQLANVNVKSLEDKIAELTAEVSAAKAEVETQQALVTEFKAQVEGSKTAVAELNTKIETLSTENAELSNKIATAEKEKTVAARVSTLVEGGLTKDEAEAKVAKFVNLNDEQFSEVANVIVANKTVETPNQTTANDVLDTAKPEEGATVGSANVDEQAGKTLKQERINSIASYFGANLVKDGE